MSRAPYLSRFTPSRTPIEILEAIFVQREHTAREAEARIADGATSKNKYHLLFVGPRGSGKTHLVTVLFNRIKGKADLANQLRIAWLEEDETTTSYFKLLLRIHRRLHKEYPGEFAPVEPKSVPAGSDGERARVLERWLVDRLQGRSLLVLVENLDNVLDGLGDIGQKQWRAFLQEKALASTIATSQQLSPAISSRTAAFHGFFRTLHLEPLDLNEAIQLLKNIAKSVTNQPDLVAWLETPTGRSRVEAISHITGGNHRLYIILSEFITRESLDDLVSPFERMIDDLTPYYQDRIKFLSPQQREIIEFLCHARETFTVNAIADGIDASPQTVSKQLKELRDLGYVRSDSVGRESRYELAEPLMRLCVEVKENQNQRIRLFVDFLKNWYTTEEIRDRLAHLAPDAVLERQYLELCMQDMAPSAQVINAQHEATESEAFQNSQIAYELINKGQFNESINYCNEAIRIKPDLALAWYNRGVALDKLGQLDIAITSFDQVIRLMPNLAQAWHSRGVVLDKLGRLNDAIASYDEALRIKPDFPEAWSSCGGTLDKLGRLDDAIASYDMALHIKSHHAHTWYNRAITLSKLNRLDDAIASYDEAIRIMPNLSQAWCNRGSALDKLGRLTDAIASYDEAIRIKPDYAHAWHNRGVALDKLGRLTDAIASYDEVIRIKPDYAQVWYKRAIAMLKCGEIAQVIPFLENFKEFSPDDARTYILQAITLIFTGAWNDGWTLLAEGLTKSNSRITKTHYYIIINSILISCPQRAVWAERVGRLVDVFRHAGKLPDLGNALVRSLKELSDRQRNNEALTAWGEVWDEAGRGLEELELPLRLFAVGLRYHRTGDQRVLFDLISEERSILAQALGLTLDPVSV